MKRIIWLQKKELISFTLFYRQWLNENQTEQKEQKIEMTEDLVNLN